MSILEFNNVTMIYDPAEGKALDNVSVEAHKGEILSVLGESGSGKTTLLRLAGGFEKPASGSIYLNGKPVAGDKVFVKPENRGVGVVFQDYALFPHLNVRENMEFGLRFMDAGAKKKRIGAMTELTGTGQLMKRFPHELSGGQKQRIALARALAPEPSLILLDEPFSSIDNVLRNQIRTEIRDILKKAGTTVLFVTHDTRDAMAMSDRICMLRNGRIIQKGTPNELYNKPLDAYIANFFGKTNIIRATVTDKGLDTVFGVFPYKGNETKPGESVLLSIRPENFVLRESNKDCMCGDIIARHFMGEYNELVCAVKTRGGTSEELILRAGPGESCKGRKCWFEPYNGKIHILKQERKG